MSGPKPRILIYSTAYYPYIGGAEVAVKEITDRLAQEFEFDLITAKMNKTSAAYEKVGAVHVYRIGFGFKTLDKLLLPFMGAWYSWKLQDERQYVCYWGIMATFATGAGYITNIVRHIMRKRTIPMILTLQEGDSDSYLKYKWGGLIHLSWKLALWRTDVLTALSSSLLTRAQTFGYEGPQFIIPNGVDLRLFAKPQKKSDVDTLVKTLGKKQDDIYLITTSRLVHKNAVDDCIRALRYLPERTYLLIIGVGPEEENLRKLARDIGKRENVKFLGFLPHEQIPLFLTVSDIFIRPSRSEGFGNSFIEAMAAGLPVVATPVGGIPDFIDDHETGVFCRPDNPKSIAEAVTEIITNPTLKEKLIHQGRERAIVRYDWNVVVQEMREKVFLPLLIPVTHGT